jgi:type IX secretion system substrate protein
MKNLLLSLLLLLIVSPLWSHSIKFVAMDRYYNEELPIDSILVHDMNTGEEKLYLTDSLFFETVSSVEELTKVNSLHLYPNPVEDILNINVNSSEIIISDISGKVHYKSSTVISGNVSLNVAGLPQGVYAFRSGNQTQTFIKNTPSNGQDVRLLSSSNSPSSLVKEAEVQSQFDYRFTIYSDGFKPKNYYTKALTKDTVVELDMSTITSAFDGKHIRVEFFLEKAKTIHFYDEHGQYQSYDTSYKDLKIVYTDTLIIRGDSIFSELLFYDNDYYSDFNKISSRQLITLKYDTIQNTIRDIKIIRFLDTINDDRGEWHNIQQDFRFNMKGSFQFDFSESSSYNSIYYLDEKIFDYVNSYKDDYSVGFIYGCIGHKSYYKYVPTILAKSYIKIEFID